MSIKKQVFISFLYTSDIIEQKIIFHVIANRGYNICQSLDDSNIYLLITNIRISMINTKFFNEINYILCKKIPIFVITVEKNGHISSEKSNTRIIDYMINFTHIICLHKNISAAIDNVFDTYEKDIVFNKYAEYYDQYFQKASEAILGCLLNNEKTIYQLANCFSTLKTFRINNISNFTASKCIIDPLGHPISDINNIRIDVSEINDWMLNELNKNPTDLYQLSPRKFEELIAEIFMRKGYDVELTPATRDGGKDIYVARKDDFGSFLYLVECKHYDPSHKVGVSVIRDLYGVLSKERATYGIVVTTSDFTKPAQEFQQNINFQMSLKNFDSIQKWLCDVT